MNLYIYIVSAQSMATRYSDMSAQSMATRIYVVSAQSMATRIYVVSAQSMASRIYVVSAQSMATRIYVVFAQSMATRIQCPHSQCYTDTVLVQPITTRTRNFRAVFKFNFLFLPLFVLSIKINKNSNLFHLSVYYGLCLIVNSY